MKSKVYLALAACISLLIIAIVFFPYASAVTITETFPGGASFSNDFGSEIQTDLSDIAFLNVIDSNNDQKDDILVIDKNGKGAVVAKGGTNYQTFSGLDFTTVPQSQIIEDFTGDNLPDIISLTPANKAFSKAWHYGKITQVANDYFTLDIPLRKNILGGSTIIAPNGKQYSVQKNNNPDDDAPRNAIYLDKELGSSAELPAYTTFLQTNQYVAYLLPTSTKVTNNNLLVHVNKGANNFVPTECPAYIPVTTESITALASMDTNGDNKKDLILISHPHTQIRTTRVQSTYSADSKILTFTFSVVANDFTARDLRGSYFSFNQYEEHLFKITANTNTEITVNIQLPPTGTSLETIKTLITSGDSFWLTLNDATSATYMNYLGDNTGCFTYTGEVKGTIFASNFGKPILPGAQSPTETDRTIITDTTISLLPADSYANRQIRVGDGAFTIEHNDQGHIYLSPEYGDITNQLPSAIQNTVATGYIILPLRPEIAINLDDANQIVSIFREIPLEITNLINAVPLPTENPWLRPLDIDQDRDIDLIFIHQNRLFLKLNNERSR